jgi:aminocarboxymuconate-semialdehyde decarboxylase
MKKIDIYNHFFPKAYVDVMMKVNPEYKDLGKRVRSLPMLFDLDKRFECMDLFGEDYYQILTVPAPPPEVLAGPDKSPDLARAANDGLAELCQKHPDRFKGFGAKLPLNNIDACIKEAHRAIDELGACGVEIYTNAAGKPLDLEEFEPLYKIMEDYDRPIWVHPIRGADFTDYLSEDKSKYEIWWVFGWPYETSAFMSRMVFSGIMDRYPNLKIITHHMGGMVPYFAGRIGPGWDVLGSRTTDEDYGAVLEGLEMRPYDYFKKFYADTALFGARGATECGLDFFGADKVVFASDSPFDPEGGTMFIRETIKIIDNLDISEQDRAKIYYKNAEKLLKLDAG